jgi:hypothetical protein
VGTDVGNPPATTEIGFEPASEDETRTATGALSLPNDYEITEAWLAIDYITLRDGADCARSGDTDSVGPYFVNLAAGGEVYPEAPRFVTPSGEYCEIRLELAPAANVPADVGAPFALRDKSIFIRGVRPDGSNFAISSDRDERITYNAEEAETFEIEPGANRLVSVFDTNTWVKLTELDTLGGDAIEVSPRINPQLYGEFRKNFLNGSELFDDTNNNGRLDVPEKARAVGRPDFIE